MQKYTDEEWKLMGEVAVLHAVVMVAEDYCNNPTEDRLEHLKINIESYYNHYPKNNL